MNCKLLFSIIIMLVARLTVVAQINPALFEPFIGQQKIITSSGPGIAQSSGDILLELGDDDNGDVETLMLLRNNGGKLSMIATNAELMMGQDMLGISGGNYPDLAGSILSVDYTIGSNSSQSDISVSFERGGNGDYYFKEYTAIHRNYGVENLFARQRITAQQTGEIDFRKATESMVFEKSKIAPLPDDADEKRYQAVERYAEFIPEDWGLALSAEGDLNLDGFKKDLLLLFYQEEACSITILLQQEDGSHQVVQTNEVLLAPDETFNPLNLNAVVKNGYFTIEQRVPTADANFDQRYITFKYDATNANWLLHRYDVEHFSGFDTKPAANVTRFTKQDFGKVLFTEMKRVPGDYAYEPQQSTISGTLVKKQFYGAPNYGETPEKDEKVWVYVLKTKYPVNIIASPDYTDPETAEKSVWNCTEIQVYTDDDAIDFKNSVGKDVTLTGVLQKAQSGHHYTPVLMYLVPTTVN